MAAGVFLGVLGLVILSIVRTQPVFEAHATLMVSTNSPSDIFGSGAIVWPTQPNISNVVMLLQSQSMRDRVAKSLPDPSILPAAAVRAAPMKDADLVSVVVSAPTANGAVEVANGYVDAYQQYDLDLNRTAVTAIRQFIEAQLAQFGNNLDSSEHNLAEFKATHKLTNINEETQDLVGRQSQLGAEYQEAIIEAKGTEAQLAQVRNEIQREGRSMADSNAVSSPLVTNLKASLNQLEVEKTNLLIHGFDKNSDRVQGLDRQTDSTRTRLRAQTQVLIAQQGLADPVGHLSGLFEMELTLGTTLAASKARQAALDSARSSFDARIARLPEAERQLAKLTRDVETGRQVHNLLSQRFEEARIQEVGKISSVQIIDRAAGANQTQPNVHSRLSFGLVLALVMALGSVWAAEFLDNSIHGTRELEHYGYSVLGSIPQLLTGGRRMRREEISSHLITHTDVESSGAEAFRMLRTALAFVSAERPVRLLAVTSPGPSEGKSTVAVNLASVLAQAGSRVLLIDADLRHPMLHHVFKRGKKPGLSDLIVLNTDPAQAIFATGLEGLYCLTCGTTPPSPADLFTLNATRDLLKRLAGQYDYVIIDTPPVLVAADSPILGALVDTTIMVVRAGRTALEALDHARTAMLGSGAQVCGVVINDVNRSGRYGRYYYYYYKYHYRYSKHAAAAAKEQDQTTKT